ncbi:hypothetical protein KY290_012931 [Solanum tuberosum]|uniref:Uncharacterized protein n=1 Tax=Solanum tuberosum TaxID=4113 RepID=A0ABQ7VKZ9_SOLTU|nr:hypothetical protein KY285_012700 [Solanum tuberosum]KAH0768950.1 hypothetical protein KY290_012931 [Solanum tuberosum]
MHDNKITLEVKVKHHRGTKINKDNKAINQVGKIANQISQRPPGTLPSDTVKNSKELKAVTLQSGKMFNDICKSKACEATKRQDETQGSQKAVGESSEIHKGNEKSELEVDSKFMSALPFPQKMK